MNVPDYMRCAWSTVGTRSLRCMCPATLSISQFCLFHRNAETVDAPGIVQWSQDATADEYLERAAKFAYPDSSPTVAAIREKIAASAHHRPASAFNGLAEWVSMCEARRAA